MPSCTSLFTYFIYYLDLGIHLPSHGPQHGGGAKGRFEQPTYRSTVEHTNHQTTITAPSRRINIIGLYPGSATGGGGLLSIAWGIVHENIPATCRPSPGGRRYIGPNIQTKHLAHSIVGRSLHQQQHNFFFIAIDVLKT